MKYDLRRPCPKCPFRPDVPAYLRGGRAQEIATAIAAGGGFPCHQTTVEVEDDEDDVEGCDRAPTPDSQMCAGALLVMENLDAPNQIVRVAERIGLYDASKLDRSAPSFGSWMEFVEHHAGDGPREEHEPCSEVGAGCEAPAGYLVGGEVIPESDPGETEECPQCGEFVCDACWDAHIEGHEEGW